VQPALDDDVTSRLFELSVQRVRGSDQGPLAILLAIGLVVWLWHVLPELSVFFGGAGLVAAWQLTTRTVSTGTRWPASARRMLSDEPWREVPVTVLDTRGTVVKFPDGEQVRVHGLSALGREVAIRAGRVWAVGPDGAGWYAVRVDGLHMPLPARRVTVRTDRAATPTAEPIVAGWGRHLVQRARGDLWFALGGTAVVTAAAVMVGTPWLVVLVVACGAGAVALGIRQLRHAARVRDAGPWERADATVPSWETRQNGLADGTIGLRFGDGRRFTAHLERVPLDLFANAWRAEELWVAGDVVGFPHYPVAAFARLTPAS
jgi:hypothetical protein